MTLSGKIFLFNRLLCSNLRESKDIMYLCLGLATRRPAAPMVFAAICMGIRQIRMQKDFASPISHSVVSGLVQIPSVENKLLNARTFIYCLLCILLFSISFIKLLMILSLAYLLDFMLAKSSYLIFISMRASTNTSTIKIQKKCKIQYFKF